MNILIAGGTGFVGRSLTDELLKEGHDIFIMTRDPKKFTTQNRLQYIPIETDYNQLPPIDAVINLAGESLFGYWTKSKKESILSSRIQITEFLVELVQKLKVKPKVFINASAVGYYGMSMSKVFTEEDCSSAQDFLANVVKKWEETASKLEQKGIRTVYARFGVILGKAGALPLMRLPVKLFAGGKIASGKQWLSWVHIQDVTGILRFALTNDSITGPINVTAPNPLRNESFMKTLCKVSNRPYWFPTPKLFMKLITGEMSELITEGQQVFPQKAIQNGYVFMFPKLEDALINIIVNSQN